MFKLLDIKQLTLSQKDVLKNLFTKKKSINTHQVLLF